MKTKKILLIIVRFLIVMTIILMILAFLLFYVNQQNNLKNLKENSTNILENLLKSEIIDKKEWKCLDYATYYNEILSEKYPQLDIRFPRHIDICNNLTMCDNYHTFLVIAGYGSECILDQKSLSCIRVLKINKTKEEYDEIWTRAIREAEY